MDQPFLSLCMIVKNESQNLARCLESAKHIVDEIIIVDTGSTDNTKEIGFSYGAKVYDYKWTDDFAAARNYANQYATGEWIIVLDADEQIAANIDIKEALRKQQNRIICNCIYIYNISVDKSTHEGYYFRVFRHLSDLYFKGRVHEQIFYQDRPLTNNEIQGIFKDEVFIKHHGDTDEKSLKKIAEFYLPMLERISSIEVTTWMELSYLQDYYRITGAFDKYDKCFEEVFED
jgi:glycosyltransferase involved in cell wall biosynthesis